MKKENLRMDILSRKRYPKKELYRLVLVEGVYVYDEASSLPGRGIYLHKDEASLQSFCNDALRSKKGLAPLKEGEKERMEAQR